MATNLREPGKMDHRPSERDAERGHDGELSSCLGFLCRDGAGGKDQRRPQTQQVSLLASEQVLK